MSIGSVTTNTYLQGDSSDYLIFVFELDQEYLYIERRAYTFIDVLGQVGGFMGILIPLGSIIVGLISNRIYWMTLISTFYDTENTNNIIVYHTIITITNVLVISFRVHRTAHNHNNNCRQCNQCAFHIFSSK